MSMPTGRSEKRTPIEVAVVLSRLNERPFTERTFTENVSSRGLRAVTRRRWQPGARLLVSFAGECIPGQARVVYCQRLANKRVAGGLALSPTSQKPGDSSSQRSTAP